MNANTAAKLACVLAGFVLMPLHGAEDRADRGAKDLDKAWDEIRAAISTAPAVNPDDKPEIVRERRAKRRKEVLAQADQAREFHRANPRHRKAQEAKHLEAMLLLRAVHEGEAEARPRMRAVVESFRKDREVPEPMRAEIAGLSGFMEAERETNEEEGRRRAFTVTARQLVAEFPQQPQGYESLLTLALESGADEAKTRLEELIAMNPPTSVKAEAERHLERFGLVGEKFETLLVGDPGAEVKAAIVPGKPVVLYSWATWSEGSLALARDLAKHDLTRAAVLALNLDHDVAAAREVAAREGLPGKMIYDASGPFGVVAARLRINGAPLIFFIDPDGTVRDVHGTQDFQQKLSGYGL